MSRPRISIGYGDRYGKLTVIEEVGMLHNTRRFKCKCDCGNVTICYMHALRGGNTTSCGCNRGKYTYGLSNTKIYGVWKNMIQRCHNPTDSRYHRYGGRGIQVCLEWKSNVKSFYDWAMSNGYQEGLEIDRENNDGNYTPFNCRWTNRVINNNNCASNLMYTYDGMTMTLSQHCNRLGLAYGTVYKRIVTYGWTIERAFTE